LIVRIYLGWGAGRIEAEFRARDISNISHQTTHNINHLRTRVNSPETNGKTERFWRTLEEELLTKEAFSSLQEAQERLNAYIDNYNCHRPHKGIDYNTPSSVYLNEDFKDRAFTNIWGLEDISDWLNEQLFSIIESSLPNTSSNLPDGAQSILTNVG